VPLTHSSLSPGETLLQPLPRTNPLSRTLQSHLLQHSLVQSTQVTSLCCFWCSFLFKNPNSLVYGFTLLWYFVSVACCGYKLVFAVLGCHCSYFFFCSVLADHITLLPCCVPPGGGHFGLFYRQAVAPSSATTASWRLAAVLKGPGGGPCFCLFLCFSCDCCLGCEAPMLQWFLHLNDLTFCCSSLVFRCN